tara:strand:- start:1162 stop:1287 length:126 start_codon:yes stop_codon:yes gene_type:complete
MKIGVASTSAENCNYWDEYFKLDTAGLKPKLISLNYSKLSN